jgi:seryl-tRNA synthetase
MLDLKAIREHPQQIAQGIKNKGEIGDVEQILKLDEKRREVIQEVENLKHQRNALSQQVSQLKRERKPADEVIRQTKEFSQTIKTLDEELKSIEIELKTELDRVPNIPHPSVPIGKDASDNVVVSTWGKIPEFDFEISDHIEIAERLDILDFPRGSKVSGRGFPVYKGQGARLERALINFMLDTQGKEHGYREIFVPFLVNRESMYGTGQIPKLEEDMYHCEQDDLFLIPTAEVPITNLHRDEMLTMEQLPVKRILELLGIPFRVIELCSADLSFAAAKCYDIEVWSPAEKDWLEASSCSNYEDFQARRLNLRFRRDSHSKPEFPHTLNGSGLATSRLMVALLETCQTDEGSVLVPEVLRSYTGFNVIKREGY